MVETTVVNRIYNVLKHDSDLRWVRCGLSEDPGDYYGSVCCVNLTVAGKEFVCCDETFWFSAVTHLNLVRVDQLYTASCGQRIDRLERYCVVVHSVRLQRILEQIKALKICSVNVCYHADWTSFKVGNRVIFWTPDYYFRKTCTWSNTRRVSNIGHWPSQIFNRSLCHAADSDLNVVAWNATDNHVFWVREATLCRLSVSVYLNLWRDWERENISCNYRCISQQSKIVGVNRAISKVPSWDFERGHFTCNRSGYVLIVPFIDRADSISIIGRYWKRVRWLETSRVFKTAELDRNRLSFFSALGRLNLNRSFSNKTTDSSRASSSLNDLWCVKLDVIWDVDLYEPVLWNHAVLIEGKGIDCTVFVVDRLVNLQVLGWVDWKNTFLCSKWGFSPHSID